MSTSDEMAKTVTVDLGERSYDIIIANDLISRIGDLIKKVAAGARCAIVTDENVAPHYLEPVQTSLKAGNLESSALIFPPGETTKSMDSLTRLLDWLLDQRFERNDVLIALGGGVIGDLAGFAAATMRRGMKFVQMPTSLLAQVDSSVGGKTGINAKQGKNLIGAFYQPSLVLADVSTLQTLEKREFAAGYAEVAKYGLINQPSFFSWLEQNRTGIFSGEEALIEAIAQSCRSKAEIVAADEQEAGQRALLNLGHTFGHALEGYCGYDPERLVHGEGVSIGMCLAHEFSNRLNHCGIEAVEKVKSHLSAVGLPTEISQIPGPKPTVDMLEQFIAQDKKVSRGTLTFILSSGLGEAFIAKDVPRSQLTSFLKDKLQ